MGTWDEIICTVDSIKLHISNNKNSVPIIKDILGNVLNQIFQTEDSVKQVYLEDTPSSYTHACNICNSKFSNSLNLYAHTKLHHKSNPMEITTSANHLSENEVSNLLSEPINIRHLLMSTNLHCEPTVALFNKAYYQRQ